MYYKKVLIILITLVSGCALFPQRVHTLYTPPSDTKNAAKVRFVGNPYYFSLSQNTSEKSRGDELILDHWPNFMTSFIKDAGFVKPPKYNNIYADGYFETYLIPEKETQIFYGLNCHIKMKFIPKSKALYQFRANTTDKSGYCVMYATEIVYDKENNAYIEKNIKGLEK